MALHVQDQFGTEASMTKEKAKKQTSEGEKSFVIYKVIRTIITSGVTPLPRNYELFYEMLSGQNTSLTRDVLALPHNPDQKLLDKLGVKHHLPSFSGLKGKNAADNHSDLITQLNLRLLKSVKQVDALNKLSKEIKEPMPTLVQAIKELHRDQHELQNFLNDETQKLAQFDAPEDSIAPIATRDTLTGLPNRLLFTEKMSELYQDKNATVTASLILCNIDRLRLHNERFGISEVNKAIYRLAHMLKRRVKSHDFVARISGNEFAVLVPGVTQETAALIADRLRLTAHKVRLSPMERITLSIGVCDTRNTENPQDFYSKAELALLASRTGKRDCVTLYDKEVAMRSRQAYLMHLKADGRSARTLA